MISRKTIPLAFIAAFAVAAVAQTIEIDSIAELGTAGYAEGRVIWTSLNPSQHAIIAMLDDGPGWAKPTWDNYLTDVDANGNFIVEITTHPNDYGADNFLFYLVERSVFAGKPGHEVITDFMATNHLAVVSVKRSVFWANQVPEPVPSVQPGFVAAGTSVALSCTAGDAIRYTLDGSPPDAHSTLYVSAFTVPATGCLIIHAVAVRAGGAVSQPASFVYLPSKPLDKPFFGLGVSLILGNENPGGTLSEALTRERLQPVAPLTQWVRTFGTINNGHEYINRIAKTELGLRTMIGLWVSGDATENTKQLNGLRAILLQGPPPDLIAVGNECSLTGVPAATVADIVISVRGILAEFGLGATVPVGSVDTGNAVWSLTALKQLDFIGVNIYCGTWDDVPESQMATATAQQYTNATQRLGKRMVLLTETGTPYAGGTYTPPYSTYQQTPSQTKAANYLTAMLDWTRNGCVPLFYFAAYDEAWKTRVTGHPIEQYFGLLGTDGALHAFYVPVVLPHLNTWKSPVPVPYTWLDPYLQWGDTTDHEALALLPGLNGYFVWESYVAGLDPTNKASKFSITNIVVKSSGGILPPNGDKDVAATINWSPDLRPSRTYKVMGKTNLTDISWHYPTNHATRFFKVSVGM